MLLVELRGGVDGARIEDRALAHGHRAQRLPAPRAGRLELARRERRARPRRGRDAAVPAAPVGAVSVHHDARPEHDAAGEAPGGESAQEDGRAEVVVRDVVRGVTHIDTHANHGRLVRDRGHTPHGACDRGGIAQVAADVLGAGISIAGFAGVRQRVEAVHDAHVMTALDQRIDDVGADEPQPPGDQHAFHAAVIDAAARPPPESFPFRKELITRTQGRASILPVDGDRRP